MHCDIVKGDICRASEVVSLIKRLVSRAVKSRLRSQGRFTVTMLEERMIARQKTVHCMLGTSELSHRLERRAYSM